MTLSPIKTATPLLLFLFAAVLGASADVSTLSASESRPLLAVVIRPADPGAKYLAVEYARDLIHVLEDAEQLSIAPRSRVLHAETTTQAAQETGRAIAANYVLSGSVRLTDNKVEIVATLTESNSGELQWSRSYASKFVEASSLSARISHDALKILGMDSPQQSPRQRDVVTANAIAWEHYLRGRLALETLTEPSLIAAIVHFEQATTADPKFVAAHVGLATAHIALGYNFQNPRAHFEKARQGLMKIAASKMPLAEAVINDAVLKYYYEWDWAAAAAGATFATQHDPSAVETHACFLHGAQAMGRLDEGQEVIAAAHHAQPESPAIRCEVPCAAYYAGKLGEAERDSRHALKSDPDNPLLYWSLARTLAQQGQFDAALAELKTAQTKPGGDWPGILSELAYVYGRQNRGDAAREIIARLRAREKSEYIDHYLYAMAFAGLGETAEVFRHLQQAMSDRSVWIPSLPTDPKFAPVRSDPRYGELMRAMKL